MNTRLNVAGPVCELYPGQKGTAYLYHPTLIEALDR